MKLITGLGNPGRQYKNTRHNAGFMVLDHAADKWGFKFRPGKGDYEWAEHSIGGERVIFLKPTTYMNLSGTAVQDVVSFYKIDLTDLLVVCDDVSLPLGKIRARKDGSDGGQKGLRSIIYQLNNDQIARLRLGIGRETPMELSDFVLSRFKDEERTQLTKVIQTAVDAVSDFITQGIDYVMNQYNGIFFHPEN